MKKVIVMVVEDEEIDNLSLARDLQLALDKNLFASLIFDLDQTYQVNGHYNMALINNKAPLWSEIREKIYQAIQLVQAAKEEFGSKILEEIANFNLSVNVNTKEKSLLVNSSLLEEWQVFCDGLKKIIGLKKL